MGFLLGQSAYSCPNLTPSFTYTSISGCGIPRTYRLYNTSSGTRAASSIYYWRYGRTGAYFDVTLAGDSTQFTSAAGNDTIWLIAVDSTGCRDSVSTILNPSTNAPRIFDDSTSTYSRSPGWYNCITSLSAPDSFRIYLSGLDTLKNYRIVWGDGDPDDTGTRLNPFQQLTHLYDSLGTYTVLIITTDNSGCTDTIFGRVGNERIPTAGVIGPPTGTNVGCVPTTIRFINNSSNVANGTSFLIDYGDGNTEVRDHLSANDTLYHSYITGLCNGTMSITAYNTCGASVTTWGPIYVNDRDIADITASFGNCSPDTPYIFYNTSTPRYCLPTTRRYFWNFGDGTTNGWITTATPQVHYFDEPGFYPVTLLDSNPCGVDTFRLIAPINYRPNPGFMVDVQSGCFPLTVNVTDTSHGLFITRIWNFGVPTDTNNISTDSMASFTYTTPGTYYIVLRVTNGCGTSIDTIEVNVWGRPTANFGTVGNGCQPRNITFSNTSTTILNPAAYFWDFDNGNTSTMQNPPAQNYLVADTFHVKLVVNDTCGADSITRTFLVFPKPEAGFAWDTVCEQAFTPFTDTSAVVTFGNSVINSWQWNFGDGNTSTQQHPQHTYADSGSYTVRLIVNTNRNCRDTFNTQVYVVSLPEALAAISDDSVCLGTAQMFDGSSTANFGSITFRHWDFGNGNGSSQEDTTFTYDTAGSYIARYIVANGFGCRDTAQLPVLIHALPVPDIGFDTVCQGQVGHFLDISTVAGGTIASRRWDFDLDGMFDSTSQNPQHTYATLGPKKVVLEVTSNFSCVALDTFDVNVYPLPVPVLSVDTGNACEFDIITFRNNSTGAAYYNYFFGDGNSRNNVYSNDSVNYVYADSGTYIARLFAVTAQGCVDSTEITVDIGPRPDAEFTVNSQVACAPFNFTFTNTSQKATGYQWFQNDTLTGVYTTRPDTLIINDTNAFVIKLVATNASICPSDTFELRIGTAKDPVAAFTNMPDSGCGPLLVNLTNASQFASTYHWNFGNGDSSNVQDTTQVFIASANNDTTYTIQLIAYNWLGCDDTIFHTVKVFPNPDVSFTQSNTDSCGPLAVSFTNTSTHNAGGTIVDMTFDWDFGNGMTSTSRDASASYISSISQDSLYNITLIGYSKNGCPDTARSDVRVYPDATANFSVSQTDSCGPFSVTFTNLSDPNDTGSINIMSFQWNFGNGVTSSRRDTTVRFAPSVTQDSSYTITLFAFTEHGCPDTVSRTVIAHPKPAAAYTQSDTAGCGPLTVNFTNTSIPYDTSTIADMTFEWNFGDGGTSTLQDPTHIFVPANANDTVYTVTLIAYSEHGCADTTTSTVRVHPGPVALFGVNQQVACAPFNFHFTNLSINSDSFTWLANGMPSHYDVQNRPDTLIATDTSTAIISLIAYSDFSCPSDTVQLTIGTARDPIASYTNTPDSGCGPLIVPFVNTSQFASTYRWTFGSSNATAQNPTRTFNAAAVNDTVYTVRLIAINWLSCRDTVFGDIKVFPNPDVSYTQSRTDSCGPLTVNFTNTSVHNAGGTIANMTFQWSFGNGMTSTQQNEQVQYFASASQDSIYNVRLVGTSKNGCRDTAISTVRVYPDPVANFAISQQDSCGPFTVNFTNLSDPNDTGSINIMSFQWNFGNGISSTRRDTAVRFAPSLTQDSTYTITLYAFSEHGCPDTFVRTVTAYPKPLAAYLQSDTSGCGPLNVNFTNTSVPYDTGTIGDMTFQWNFGDGSTATIQSPSHVFLPAAANDTVYTVTLIAFSEHDCSDTFSTTVRVHPGPVALFSVNSMVGCAPFDAQFTNESFNADSFVWLADGNISHIDILNRPDTIITTDTTLAEIGLIALSRFGCPDDTVYHTIGTARDPIASFAHVPDSGCGPLTVNFTNTSQFALTYQWNFGNGMTSTRSDTSSTFLASQLSDSVYTIRLIALNWLGCRDTVFDDVTVFPNPDVSFTQSRLDSCGPLTVNFTNTSVHNAGGTIADMSFQWNFGNGAMGTQQDNTIAYDASVTQDTLYQVTLIGFSRNGCPDTARSTVRVYPDPVASFTVNRQDSCGPFTVSFTNQSDPHDTGNISMMSFQWDFGNGVTSTRRDTAVRFAPSLTQDSTYTITLYAFSEHGCPDTFSRTVTAYPKPRASYVQSDTGGCGPLDVTFTNTSTPYDTGSISIMSFQWNFGNGITSVRQDTTVRYIAAIGVDTVYTVRLIATSEHGCLDTTTSTVRIFPKPTVAFTQSDTVKCEPMIVDFFGTGNNVATYHWNFGDGDSSNAQNPTHQFFGIPLTDTTYGISLIGESPYGCLSDTASSYAKVKGLPLAAFFPSPDSVCATAKVQMVNQSKGGIDFFWDFGNGDTSTEVSPSSTFLLNPAADTAYRVSMIVTNYNGCTDTAVEYVVVSPVPTARIFADTIQGCSPLQVQFSDSSIFGVTYAWHFSNGSTSTLKDPQSIFTNTGGIDSVYRISLITKNLGGCPDTAYIDVRVFPRPTINFTAIPADGCGPLPVSFVNGSIPNDTGDISIMTFSWDFGNGDTSTLQDGSSVFQKAATRDSVYAVKLVGFSEHGCKDSLSKNVRVYPDPVASFQLSDTAACGPANIRFTNTSIPNDTGNISIMSFQWDFGNGNISYKQNDSTIYAPAFGVDSIYYIRLIAQSEHGCRDTIDSSVRIYPKLASLFTVDRNNECGPMTVNFTHSGVSIVSFFWDFGNGDTSSEENPTRTFVNNGFGDSVYVVKHFGRTVQACPSDTFSYNIVVHPSPSASFVRNTGLLCGDKQVIFTNTTLGGVSYSWNFGNGQASTQTHPVTTFEAGNGDTSYIVTMAATSVYGCVDSASDTVDVYPYPVAGFMIDTAAGCTPFTAHFSETSSPVQTYAWNFGNGNTSTDTAATQVFTNGSLLDTFVNVKLVVTTDHGCSDSISKQVRVYPLPTVQFTAPNLDGCGPLHVNFQNASVPNDTGSINIMTFGWDLGNGNTSTLRNPSSDYLASATMDSVYQVKLVGYSEHGCRDSAIREVRVYPRPLAEFTMVDSVGCGPLLTQFINQSTPYDTGSINIMTFQWNFGNGNVSTLVNNTSTYSPSATQDSVYTVRLIATSEHFCKDTVQKQVRVKPKPVVDFTYNPGSGCGPLSVNFSGSGANVNTYHWDFGNGDTSMLQNPNGIIFQKRPVTDTTYEVSLWAASPFGCMSDTVIKPVIVYPDPIASFVKNLDSACGNRQLIFTNTSTGATSYAWNFGNGNTSTQVNPVQNFNHSLLQDTTFNVRLIATSANNCTDTITGTVTLFPYPHADFTTDVNVGCTPLGIRFSQSANLGTTYTWYFGNGQVVNDTASTQTFANGSTLDTIITNKLVVTTNRGCRDSIERTIRIYPTPTVNFSANTFSGCGPLAVNFNNQSRPNDTGTINIMTFNWTLGNGNTSTSMHPAASYSASLTQDSMYDVKLVGWSEHGCVDSITKQVHVYPKPLAEFTMVDSVGCGPLMTRFINQSVPYDTGTINIMSFVWNFGNGLTSASTHDTVIFYPSITQDSVYTVTLYANSEHGCKDTVQKQVRVKPKPGIDFTADRYNGCGPLTVQFNSTERNADSLFWDFANGQQSNDTSPQITFGNQSLVDTIYAVRLWAKSDIACMSDTVTKNIIVRPDPIADFNPGTDSLCGNGLIQFFNISQQASSFSWNFGDGGTSTQANPQHAFAMDPDKDTAYPVQLIVTSIYGCRDTMVKPATILPLPRSRPIPQIIGGCTPIPVNFVDTSHLAADYHWNFGDGDTAVGPNPSHTFVNNTTLTIYYNVVLTTTTIHGCVDDDTVPVTIYPLPIPAFTVNKSGICDTSNYRFTNVSNGGSASYHWDFGDGDTSNIASPTHIYPAASISDTVFTARLIAISQYGCRDTVEHQVVVTPQVYAFASANGAAGCQPLRVPFVNNSRNAVQHYWSFGDGNISTDSAATHTYVNVDTFARTYPVMLVVIDRYGCTDTSRTQVNVAANTDAIFTGIKVPDCNRALFQMNNLSRGATQYDWNFGDGGTSTQRSPQHQFPVAANNDSIFTVRLITSNASNCRDTSYMNVTVNPIVNANFDVSDTSACGFMNVDFTNLSRNATYYQWSFGNGVNTSAENPQYTYAIPGSYQVRLIAFDAYGCSDTFTYPAALNVYEIPQANFITDVTNMRLPQNNVQCTDLSLSSLPLQYNWDFDDPGSGANNTSTTQNPAHVFSDSGTFLITMIINNNHCYDTAQRQVRVDYFLPIASFDETPDQGCQPLEVQFTNNSQYATSYQWFFGDGGKSTEENPTHIYNVPGTFTVILIVTGPGGIDDTVKVDVITVHEKPRAIFYAIPRERYLPDNGFTLFNESIGAVDYEWNIFDEDNSSVYFSSDPSPTATLPGSGEYTIRLIAISDQGCRDTAIEPNYLKLHEDGEILVPDAFTPNGDDRNDGFRPTMIGVSDQEYIFQVYNRWGEKMYETTDINAAWDGKFMGAECQIDVYVWQVSGKFISGRKFSNKGRVTLVR